MWGCRPQSLVLLTALTALTVLYRAGCGVASPAPSPDPSTPSCPYLHRTAIPSGARTVLTALTAQTALPTGAIIAPTALTALTAAALRVQSAELLDVCWQKLP